MDPVLALLLCNLNQALIPGMEFCRVMFEVAVTILVSQVAKPFVDFLGQCIAFTVPVVKPAELWFRIQVRESGLESVRT
ncbi:MAG: hypothetical protein JNM42_02635 [Propionivibrio sp.]|uniref:hypothetical protein n=1 Tax=Propionivibrio sp. TaxID=2212460 RepID=UPI001A3DA28F|nr:hypothetical protein [Propionivibrio sp.]MBL8413314.1 hypothetical protein [Propionivibrio sp.]